MNPKLTTVMFAFVCCTMSVSAQETVQNGTAAIDANYCLTINPEQPLSKYYEVDISEMRFESESDAKNAFGMKSNNLISYNVDYLNKRVMVQLHFERLKDEKSREWWSNYLLKTCGNY